MELWDSDRINQIKKRLAEATPGPWYAYYLDDPYSMNLFAVTTQPDSGMHPALDDNIRDSIIATTLLQNNLDDVGSKHPKFVEVTLDEDRTGEDAEFIAHARSDIEYLLQLVEVLRGKG